MKKPSIPENESERLQALFQYQILDTEAEMEFDELVQLASHICKVPVSFISLIDKDRQWSKAKVGFDAEETPPVRIFLCSRYSSGRNIYCQRYNLG